MLSEFSLRVHTLGAALDAGVTAIKETSRNLAPQGPYSIVIMNNKNVSDISVVFTAHLELGWNKNLEFDCIQKAIRIAQRESLYDCWESVVSEDPRR